jgi:hypothetical protein
MSKKTLHTLMLTLYAGCIACTKVVKLPLRSAPTQYVIEGDITDQPGPYLVRIFQTTAFYNSNNFKGIAGAKVQIEDNQGNNELLADNGEGNYYTRRLRGSPGNTYTLTVIIAADTFRAASTMPSLVPLDGVVVNQITNSGKPVLVAMPEFINPPGAGLSYYLFNQTINGALDKTLYYWSSQNSAGQANSFDLARSDPDSTLHVGDSIQVEMQCIDKSMYTYWSSLDAAATGNGTSYPGNPVTNLAGGALGYFSAHTSRVKARRVN